MYYHGRLCVYVLLVRCGFCGHYLGRKVLTRVTSVCQIYLHDDATLTPGDYTIKEITVLSDFGM